MLVHLSCPLLLHKKKRNNLRYMVAKGILIVIALRYDFDLKIGDDTCNLDFFLNFTFPRSLLLVQIIIKKDLTWDLNLVGSMMVEAMFVCVLMIPARFVHITENLHFLILTVVFGCLSSIHKASRRTFNVFVYRHPTTIYNISDFFFLSSSLAFIHNTIFWEGGTWYIVIIIVLHQSWDYKLALVFLYVQIICHHYTYHKVYVIWHGVLLLLSARGLVGLTIFVDLIWFWPFVFARQRKNV